jgi:hypothetical protein
MGARGSPAESAASRAENGMGQAWLWEGARSPPNPE